MLKKLKGIEGCHTSFLGWDFQVQDHHGGGVYLETPGAIVRSWDKTFPGTGALPQAALNPRQTPLREG
jgi:hypothetical protein